MRLLDAQVSIDRRIASGTRKVLVLPVWNMKVGLRVSELFSKTEVDDVDLIPALANAYQEIVRLDIAMAKGCSLVQWRAYAPEEDSDKQIGE